MKEIFARFQNKAALVLAPVGVMALTASTAFAVDPDPLPTIAITQDMLKPLVTGVVSNLGVILPIGIGLFAILLGVRLIPSVVSRFLKM